MGLLDTARRFVVSLADDRPPRGYNREIGKRVPDKDYGRVEDRVKNLGIEDYRKMWTNDGKVAALVMLYTLPIRSTGFEVNATDGDKGEADFIRENFTQPMDRGGLATPLAYVIEDMAYAPFEGFRAYEKVWYDYQGGIRLKKLAPRDPLTLEVETDDNGDLKDVIQNMWEQTKNRKVSIPPEKMTFVTYNKVVDPYYGDSILKPAWYHYDKKHKLYYIAHVAAEVQTVPPRLLKHNNMDAGQRAELEDALDRLGLESRISYNKNMAEIEFMDVGSGTKVDIKEMINHHDSQMSKAVLAMWIDLSSEGSSSGSRALAEPMIDLYLKNVEGIMNLMEDAINYDVIPQLIRWNFGPNASYPEFRFETIRNETEQVLFDTFQEYAKAGRLPDMLNRGVMTQIADKLGIELKDEDFEVPEEETEEEIEQETPQFVERPQQHIIHSHDDHEHKHEKVDAITLAELAEGTKIDLQDMAKKLPRFERKMQQAAESVLDRVQDDITDELQRIVEEKDISAIKDIDIGSKDVYRERMLNVANDVYNYSKTKVSEEMEINTPATSQEAKDRLEATVDNSVDRQYSNLSSEIGSIALAAVEANWGPEQVEAAVTTEFTGFENENLLKAIPLIIYEILNRARQDVFKENEGLIVAYRYRNDLENILRGVVCPYCQSLSGMTVEITDDGFHRFHPPQHFNCACMWEPVMPGESYNVTGVPSQLPVYDTIDQFRQIDKGEINQIRASLNLPKVKLDDMSDELLQLAGMTDMDNDDVNKMKEEIKELKESAQDTKELAEKNKELEELLLRLTDGE